MAPGKVDVVSLRAFRETGFYMRVAWSAEEALARAIDARLMVPDLPKRSYYFRRNRIARMLRRSWPNFGRDLLLFDCRRDVMLFLMWCDFAVGDVLANPRRRKWVYLFDTWEPQWAQIGKYMKEWRNIGGVMFSSSQAAEHFREIMPFPVFWCPQAADAREFEIPAPPAKRARSIVNIGRPNRALDDFFIRFAERHGFRYVSQRTPLGTIFKYRADFVRELLGSSIVVVHPRNIDSPEVTGKVSMLTARYFEAYQSGAVVCGFKPNSGEFEKVLGDYPFVEFTGEKAFQEELLEQLKNPRVWAEARNRALKEHSWDARASMMGSWIAEGMRG